MYFLDELIMAREQRRSIDDQIAVLAEQLQKYRIKWTL